MSSSARLVLLLLLLALVTAGDDRVLSRKKRYLLFPPNSLMTLSACLAKGGIILSPPAFVFTFDWDLAFALPTNTSLLHRFHPAYKTNRRERRELYVGMEALLERQGLNGRACVLRALCEAQRNLHPEGELMEEIFHAMFSLLPDEGDAQDEDFQIISEELRDYDIAHNHGRAQRECHLLYSSCPVSLLDLALW
ncbi:hypothetical protein B566_EDAN008664 [Ephemera danica]|nr:hypothetical protein B566_EDAN008664 [Ephemera danica]